MSSALKFNCFLFNKNPNIDPLTNKPLNEIEKQLWRMRCEQLNPEQQPTRIVRIQEPIEEDEIEEDGNKRIRILEKQLNEKLSKNLGACEYLQKNNFRLDPYSGKPMNDDNKLKWTNFCFQTNQRIKNKQPPLDFPERSSNKIKLTNPPIPIPQKLPNKKIKEISTNIDKKYLPFLNQEFVMNDFDTLIYRAEMINSDKFLYELNIAYINDKQLYKKPYNNDNFIWILNLFYKIQLPPLGVDQNMPESVYILFYENFNIQSYLNINNQVAKNNNKIDLDLSLFINILLNFLKFIKTPPFNKYIPPNLNKYIKAKPGAIIANPQS